MRINLQTLEDILLDMKCKFADAIYSNYIKDMYAIQGCDSEIDIDELRDFIYIMESKIKILKYNFSKIEKDCIIEPSRLRKTSIEFFYEKDKQLKDCNRKFLEKIL